MINPFKNDQTAPSNEAAHSTETVRQYRDRLRSEGRLAEDPDFQSALGLAFKLRDHLSQQPQVPSYTPGPEVRTAAAAAQTAEATQALVEAFNNQLSLLQRMAKASDTRADIEEGYHTKDHRLDQWILIFSVLATSLVALTFLASLFSWHI